jgi:adenylate cyclase
VLGDIGTHRDMAFAVIGDTVNTGSRLQALTRELGCKAVASGALMAAREREQAHTASQDVPLIDGGQQRLRGKQEPIRVWLLDPIHTEMRINGEERPQDQPPLAMR